MSKLIITIDGPAAAGKGTISYLIARHYGLIHLDGGAFYRGVAWLAHRHGVDITEDRQDRILSLMRQHPVSVNMNQLENNGPKEVVQCGEIDITANIRKEHIGELASRVGGLPRLREAIMIDQRKVAHEAARGVVAEGRDAGIVVFPTANLKIYLTAAAEVRAQRRHAELVELGQQISYDEVYSDLQERDRRDTERAFSALRVADDAVVIDGSRLTIEQVVAKIQRLVDALLEHV